MLGLKIVLNGGVNVYTSAVVLKLLICNKFLFFNVNIFKKLLQISIKYTLSKDRQNHYIVRSSRTRTTSDLNYDMFPIKIMHAISV